MHLFQLKYLNDIDNVTDDLKVMLTHIASILDLAECTYSFNKTPRKLLFS